ncbi:fasciclin domain-containing protein [Jannaschia formosa]|uniref:fasciclin domain-containing protein n=1 Tax=Jannaschia formosa TaxID=2259592 RepID=UPI000E1C1BC1|nr:fasciclin domain-containing protein [Jannaschia formosa]TFL18708.1 fasciclin domain-containing protein [Jannaschia formosa]
MILFLLVLLGLLVLAAPLSAAPLGTVLAEDGRLDALADTALLDRFEAAGGGTVLAPTDAAFRRLPEALVERLSRPQAEAALRAVLALHLIPSGPHPSNALPVEMRPLAGDTRIVTTCRRGALTFRTTPPEEAETTPGARAPSEARVRAGSIRADAAVIHALDAVLLPHDLEARLNRLDPATPPAQADAAAPDEPSARTVASEPAASGPPAPTWYRGGENVYVYDPAAQGDAAPGEPGAAARRTGRTRHRDRPARSGGLRAGKG